MQAKPTRASRSDGLDAQRFEEMWRSGSFSVLVSRITAELERVRLACERADGDVELRRAQGAAAALRTVLGLPKRILGEMRAKAPGGE